jgi:hypothetical protein
MIGTGDTRQGIARVEWYVFIFNYFFGLSGFAVFILYLCYSYLVKFEM